MKKRFLLTSFTFAILLGLCFGTTLATTLFKPIRAAINPSYTYSLNGKTILKNQPALIYRGMIYAPLADLSGALGYTATVQEDSARIVTPKPIPPTKPSNVTIDRAIITAIDFASDRVTVYPIGQPNNQIDLLVTPQTVLKYSGGTTASMTDLNTNLTVKVVHSPNVTKSNPPQATAVSITILSPSTPIQPR